MCFWIFFVLYQVSWVYGLQWCNEETGARCAECFIADSSAGNRAFEFELLTRTSNYSALCVRIKRVDLTTCVRVLNLDSSMITLVDYTEHIDLRHRQQVKGNRSTDSFRTRKRPHISCRRMLPRAPHNSKTEKRVYTKRISGTDGPM